MRGRSYTPSPPRGYGRRGRSPAPRGRHSSRGGDGPTSLLVRNLRRDCRPEDLKRRFGQFGQVKDVYLPRDYYSGEPRGFGFIQYVEPADAADAQYQMDGQIMSGREVTVVFAEENRKKPTEMRARERGGGGVRGRTNDRRRSPPRYSRSPPPRSRDYYSPKRRYSRSISPRDKRYSRSPPRERSYSRSPPREREPSVPPYNGTRNYSGSPVRERSPVGSRSRSQSQSRQHLSPPPVRGRSRQHRSPPPVRGRSPSRSQSRSPPYPPAEYSRGRPRSDDRSPSQ